MIAAPPFGVGAVNETVAVVVPVTVAAPITGAPGAPGTVTDHALDRLNMPPLRYLAK
jgi:hypothetical protein